MNTQDCSRFSKTLLPSGMFSVVRRIGTAILTPLRFSVRSGHFKSSLRAIALDREGKPIPWYTLPMIHFLQCREFRDKTVLEFGAGQSTLWWGARAKQVTSFESDPEWMASLKPSLPPNVELFQVSIANAQNCVHEVRERLDQKPGERFDLILIDGLWRYELVPLACEKLAPGGAIIIDNSEGYGVEDAFRTREFARVDFYGYAPGVLRPHCTSLFFKESCFLFDPSVAILRATEMT